MFFFFCFSSKRMKLKNCYCRSGKRRMGSATTHIRQQLKCHKCVMFLVSSSSLPSSHRHRRRQSKTNNKILFHVLTLHAFDFLLSKKPKLAQPKRQKNEALEWKMFDYDYRIKSQTFASFIWRDTHACSS